MIHRIYKDWLHWGGKGFHFGFHRSGNRWKFRFEKSVFYNCVFYNYWRLFFAHDIEPGSRTKGE